MTVSELTIFSLSFFNIEEFVYENKTLRENMAAIAKTWQRLMDNIENVDDQESALATRCQILDYEFV